MDAADRRIVQTTQGGLPLEPRPYHAVAEATGMGPAEVMARMERMLAEGSLIAPQTQLVAGDLSGIESGSNTLKKGVRGIKLVLDI